MLKDLHVMLKDLQVIILGNYENFKVEIGEWKKRWIWCGHWQILKVKKEPPHPPPKSPPNNPHPKNPLVPATNNYPIEKKSIGSMQVRSCKCISLDLKRAQSNFWRFCVVVPLQV